MQLKLQQENIQFTLCCRYLVITLKQQSNMHIIPNSSLYVHSVMNMQIYEFHDNLNKRYIT